MYVFLGLGLTGGVLICFFETFYVKYGGIGGFTGRARRYSFRVSNRSWMKDCTSTNERKTIL